MASYWLIFAEVATSTKWLLQLLALKIVLVYDIATILPFFAPPLSYSVITTAPLDFSSCTESFFIYFCGGP